MWRITLLRVVSFGILAFKNVGEERRPKGVGEERNFKTPIGK